jgi:hypothetical protein
VDREYSQWEGTYDLGIFPGIFPRPRNFGNLWEFKGIYKSALKIIEIDQPKLHFTLI